MKSHQIGSATLVMTVDRHEFSSVCHDEAIARYPRFFHVRHRVFDEHPALHQVHLSAAASAELLETIANFGRDVGGAIASRSLHVDADRFLVVQGKRARLFGRVFDRRD
jgi:hypothetical protein